MRYLLIALVFTGCASSWSARDSRTLQRIADALENYLENHDTRHNEWMIPRVPKSVTPKLFDTTWHRLDSSWGNKTTTPSIWKRGIIDTVKKPINLKIRFVFDSLPAYSPDLEPIGYAKFGRTTVVSRGKYKNLPDTLRLAKYSRGCIHRADGTHEYTFWRIVRSGRLTYSYPIKPPKDTAGVTIYNECKD